MKKVLLPIVTLICLATGITGQATFSLQVFTDDYENITNGTSLNNGITWDDPQYAIPFGFDFTFYDTTVSEIFIDDFGLGGILSTDSSEFAILSFLIPYGADIIDRGYDPIADTLTPTSESNISYVVEGAAGQRILKVEWNNAGFFNELFFSGVSTDYVNFQMWIYEEDSSIEFRYGPKSISNPFLAFDGLPGTFVGFIREYDIFRDTFTYPAYLLEGPPNQPTPVLLSSQDTIYTLSGIIPEGTVYRFERIMVNTNDESQVQNAIRLYPNPGVQLTVESDDGVTIRSVAVRDALGRLLYVDNLTDVIETADRLPSGTYLIEVRTDKGTSHHKWIKSR